MSITLAALLYLAASVCFIMALRGLSSRACPLFGFLRFQGESSSLLFHSVALLCEDRRGKVPSEGEVAIRRRSVFFSIFSHPCPCPPISPSFTVLTRALI